MNKQPEQILYPIQYFSMFDSLLTSQLETALEQYDSIGYAVNRPYLLDTKTVSRIERLYTAETESALCYRNQIAYWKKEGLSSDQKIDVAAFTDKLETWEDLIKKILAWVPQLKNTTIETLFEKDELELGLEALLDFMDEEDENQSIVLDWPDACPMLASIQQKYFVRAYIPLKLGLSEAHVIERITAYSYGCLDPITDELSFVTAFHEEDKRVMDQTPGLVPLPTELMEDIVSHQLYELIDGTLVPIETEANSKFIFTYANKLIDVMVDGWPV